MTRSALTRFRLGWWLANSIGFVMGHLVYGVLSHGITGPHGDQLTAAQYVAHTVGLLAVAAIVFPLQARALQPLHSPGLKRIVWGTLIYITVFWIGARGIRPPADWILGLTVLGSALWVGAPVQARAKWLWRPLGVLLFPCGMRFIIPVGDAAISAGMLDLQAQDLANHVVIWLVIGGSTGVAGGLLSSWPLGRLLSASSDSEERTP